MSVAGQFIGGCWLMGHEWYVGAKGYLYCRWCDKVLR